MYRVRLLAIALLALPVAAQTRAPAPDPPPTGFSSIEPLWPAGHVPGAVGTEAADVPKLYLYPAPGPGPHAAVVVLPGGGYTHLVMDNEGGVEARWLNSVGISAYVLQYRLWPRYRYPFPLVDGIAAVRYVRSHAKEWNVRADAIGVWGFSAGGHMAGYLATVDPYIINPPLDRSSGTEPRSTISAHPDFAILSYARVDLNPSIPGTSGMATLVGEHPSQAELDAVNPILHVTARTSPSFIYAPNTTRRSTPPTRLTSSKPSKPPMFPLNFTSSNSAPTARTWAPTSLSSRSSASTRYSFNIGCSCTDGRRSSGKK